MELADAGIPFQSQAMVPVRYKGRSIPLGFRSDIVVTPSSWKSRRSPPLYQPMRRKS